METGRHELTADTEALQEQFRHVYWIGGGIRLSYNLDATNSIIRMPT